MRVYFYFSQQTRNSLFSCHKNILFSRVVVFIEITFVCKVPTMNFVNNYLMYKLLFDEPSKQLGGRRPTSRAPSAYLGLAARRGSTLAVNTVGDGRKISSEFRGSSADISSPPVHLSIKQRLQRKRSGSWDGTSAFTSSAPIQRTERGRIGSRQALFDSHKPEFKAYINDKPKLSDASTTGLVSLPPLEVAALKLEHFQRKRSSCPENVIANDAKQQSLHTKCKEVESLSPTSENAMCDILSSYLKLYQFAWKDDQAHIHRGGKSKPRETGKPAKRAEVEDLISFSSSEFNSKHDDQHIQITSPSILRKHSAIDFRDSDSSAHTESIGRRAFSVATVTPKQTTKMSRANGPRASCPSASAADSRQRIKPHPLQRSKTVERPLPSLLLILQFEPSIGFVILTVDSAKNVDCPTGSFVRILMFEHQKLVDCKETSMVVGTDEPAFKQAYMFGLGNTDIDCITFVVEMWAKVDDEDVASNLGHVVLGADAGGAGTAQWANMVKHRGFPSSMWQKLAINPEDVL